MSRLPVRVVVLVAVASAIAGLAAATASGSLADRYLRAIQDASVPLPTEVVTTLWPVSDSNPRLEWRDETRAELAVAAVMSEDTYSRFYASGSGTTPSSRPVLWVSLAPQLRAWCKKLQLRGKKLSLRVKQRLGLPPTGDYTRVVELWVGRDRLLRPCPDPEIDDTTCELAASGTPAVTGVPDYAAFFASLYVASYRGDGYPWTRLGYTYDWSGRSEVGVSEYMLVPSTAYTVRNASTVVGYCA